MTSIFKANRIALVTGASAGIGVELTKVLAPKLDSLIVVARRVERLRHKTFNLAFRRLISQSRRQIYPIRKRFTSWCGNWTRAISTLTCWLTTPAWVNLNCSKDRHRAESARSSKSTLLPCSASRIIFCLR